MSQAELYWLPPSTDFREIVNAKPPSDFSWDELVALAGTRLDLLKTNKLAKVLAQSFPAAPPEARNSPVRVAVLGSSTVDHLLASIRVAGLRRGMWIETYTSHYGQYFQDLMDEASPLYTFGPDVVLLTLDARHIFNGVDLSRSEESLDNKLAFLTRLWTLAREKLGARVIQQSLLQIYPRLMGSNEHRHAASPSAFIHRLNEAMTAAAAEHGADMLSLDATVARDGMAQWYNPVLWHRAKQEISPGVAPIYGDLVGRLIAARKGLSSKCLVLDLDHTLWGGVIGDDGLEGIHLGQGSALGEAYVEFQQYALSLAQRGIALAVCSKNDEKNARAPFESHPEMVLKLDHIACFVANWHDKPSNLRHIAKSLNIGLDSLVFADDNPFERNIVRRELPMVGVPELPEDAALYAACIADGGYFEAPEITREDMERSNQYQANLKRQAAMDQFTDMAGYLESLNMQLLWGPFDTVGLSRIVQLINKSNQFNLTTRRYDEADARAVMEDPSAMTFQLRLVDSLGDNGMISVVIGRKVDASTVDLDTWLMSCRVLGREVERETMNIVVREAKARGFSRITATYIPSAKNEMVANHYAGLGFAAAGSDADGRTFWELDLEGYMPFNTKIIDKESLTS